MSVALAKYEATVTINQATKIAGVSRRTIYYWLEAGKIRYVRTAGGSVRIFPKSLFLNEGKIRRRWSEQP